MVIYLFATNQQNLVQGPARCLAPSASTGVLLVDRQADRHLGIQDLDRFISICSWFYYRMAISAVVTRQGL